MVVDWFGYRGTCRGRFQDRNSAAVERRLSAARAALAVASLAAVVVEHAPEVSVPGVVCLSGFAFYSLLVMAALSRRGGGAPPRVLLLHVADLAWAVLVFSFNQGMNGPFLGYYLFVLLAAGFRWGLVETAVTGAVAIVAAAADTAARPWLVPGTEIDWHAAAIRLVYVLVGTLLIGYLAEDERRHREEASVTAEILGRIRPESGMVASLRNMLDALTARLCARRATLAVVESDSGRVFLWEAEAESGGARPSIRLRQPHSADCGTWLFDVPPGVAAWRAQRHGRRVRVTAVDATGQPTAASVNASPLLEAPCAWSQAFCVQAAGGEGWRGRLFIFDPEVWRPGEHLLRFLQAVVAQAAPAVLNLYLQRRLRSRSGAVERADISRQLHDGVIQSLIGVEMQVDVLRRESAAASSGSTEELQGIQKVLGEEVLNLRDLMQVLRPADVGPDRLLEHLAGELAHFRNRTHIEARLVCQEDEIDLSPRVCREVAGIVREALANVRKHSGASSVILRLAREGTGWQLTIDDDGRGFPFEGTFDGDELAQRNASPVMIGERVRAIGGRLTVSSFPGAGARLDIHVPGRHDA